MKAKKEINFKIKARWTHKNGLPVQICFWFHHKCPIYTTCICCLLLIDNVVYRKKIYWNSLIHLAVRKVVGESRRFYWHFQSAKLSQTDKSAATNLLKIFLRFYYFYEQIQRQQSFIKLIDRLVHNQTKMENITRL